MIYAKFCIVRESTNSIHILLFIRAMMVAVKILSIIITKMIAVKILVFFKKFYLIYIGGQKETPPFGGASAQSTRTAVCLAD